VDGDQLAACRDPPATAPSDANDSPLFLRGCMIYDVAECS
jgi:hypothetical protein